MAAQAGWYVDPRDDRQYRYWDGDRWSQSTQPIPGLDAGAEPLGSLSGGGSKEAPGSAAFDAALDDSTIAINGDGPIADFMWTSGFGESADDPVAHAGPAVFSPTASTTPETPAPPVTPVSPAWEPVVTPEVDRPTVAASAPDPAFTPLAPVPPLPAANGNGATAPPPPVLPSPPQPGPLFDPTEAAAPAASGSLFEPPARAVDDGHASPGEGPSPFGGPPAAAPSAPVVPINPATPSPIASPALGHPVGGSLAADGADASIPSDLTIPTVGRQSAPKPRRWRQGSKIDRWAVEQEELDPAFLQPGAEQHLGAPAPAPGGQVGSIPGAAPLGSGVPASGGPSFGAPTAPGSGGPSFSGPGVGGPGVGGPGLGAPGAGGPFAGGALGDASTAPSMSPSMSMSPLPDPPAAPTANAFEPASMSPAFTEPGADSPFAGLPLDPNFGLPDDSGSKRGKRSKGKKPKKVSAAPLTAAGAGAADAGGPASGKGAKNAKGGEKKSNLPLLLGILAVAVVGALLYLFVFRDDGTSDAGSTTASTTAAAGATTTAAGATTAAPTTAAASPSTTAAGTATTAAGAPTTTVATANVAALQAAFDAEATRACDAIKADPGLLTENVIRYDQAWAQIPKTYQDLQKSVNDCSFQARDEALKRVAAANGG